MLLYLDMKHRPNSENEEKTKIHNKAAAIKSDDITTLFNLDILWIIYFYH
jgi:hypothetical protein